MAPQSRLTIRPMRVSDLVAAIELWEATEGLGRIDPLETLERYVERNAGISSVAEVVRSDSERTPATESSTGELAAAVLCGHDGRRGYLYHLVVAPVYRQRELGRRLVEFSLAALFATGVTRCTAFLYQENDAALAFWQRVGWEQRTDLHIVVANKPVSHVG